MKYKEIYQGVILWKKTSLVEIVVFWNRVLCCSEVLWEFKEKQLFFEDRNVKIMGWIFVDNRKFIDYCENSIIGLNK